MFMRIGNSIPVSGSYMSKKTCTAAREIMVTCLFTQESTISALNAVSLTGQSQYLHHVLVEQSSNSVLGIQQAWLYF